MLFLNTASIVLQTLMLPQQQRLQHNFKMTHNKKLKIGNSYVNIGDYTYGAENINYFESGSGNYCTIGKFCSIAPKVTLLLDGNHHHEWITTYPFSYHHIEEFGENDNIKKWKGMNRGPIIIGNDVWISTGVTIMHGVTIGDGAIIGTNALVLKNVSPYQIVGGVPAKLIRNRFNDEIINLLLELKWWEFENINIKEIVNDICQKPTKELLLKLINKYRKNNTNKVKN